MQNSKKLSQLMTVCKWLSSKLVRRFENLSFEILFFTFHKFMSGKVRGVDIEFKFFKTYFWLILSFWLTQIQNFANFQNLKSLCFIGSLLPDCLPVIVSNGEEESPPGMHYLINFYQSFLMSYQYVIVFVRHKP